MPILNCPIREQHKRHPNAVAVHLPDNKITYAQLDIHVSSREKELKSQGIAMNDSVAFCDDNSLSLIVSLFAIVRIGAIFCPLSHRLTHDEIKSLLSRTGINTLWHASKLIIEGVNSLTLNDDFLENQSDSSSNSTSNDDTQASANIVLNNAIAATIIFTSGSTGYPKATVHSLNNHYYSALGSQSVVKLNESDCWLASLPINHIGGLAIIMRCFIAGASIALVDRKNLLNSFQQYPITHASLVPTQLFRLLQQYFHENKTKAITSNPLSLKYLLLGGAPISTSLLKRTSVLGLNVFHSYGLTEMCSQVATTSAQKHSFAEPLPYRQWRLENDEIVLAGKTLFLGYMVEGKIQSPCHEGWFYSNDLAQVTPDGLRITGRKDNVFIVGGENYQPEIIEKTIMEYPMIDNVIIVGVTEDEWGTIPVAFIDWQQSPEIPALIDYLTKKVDRIKIPKHFLDWPIKTSELLKPNRKQFEQQAKNMIANTKPQ